MAPTVMWNAEARRYVEGPWLWHVVPGFAAVPNLTIARSTHPNFPESARLFGLTGDHASRLERHLGGAHRGPGWTVTVHSKSYLGVCTFRIRDAGNPGQVLGSDEGGRVTLVAEGGDDDHRTLWYILPAFPDGWDIHHAATGQKLVAATDDAQSLRLSPALGAPDHWEIWRPAPDVQGHRSHFWLPDFFCHALGPGTLPRWSTLSDPMEAVVGTVVSAGSNERRPAATAAECMERCRANGNCTVASFDDEKQCSLWTAGGVTLDPVSDSALVDAFLLAAHGRIRGDARVVEQQRRLLRDGRQRTSGTGGTGEYGEEMPRNKGRLATYFRRKAGEPDAIARYRQCLVRYGPDHRVCAAVLDASAPERPVDDTKDQVLGGTDGICQGPNLRSALCTRYCADSRRRASNRCTQNLRSLCQTQTRGGAEEPLCHCWMPPATYDAIQEEAAKKLATNDPSSDKLVQSIHQMMVKSEAQPYCWYEPCNLALNKPTDHCPSTQTLACIQISQGNTFKSGGTVNHNQVCNLNASMNNDTPAVRKEGTTTTTPAPPSTTAAPTATNAAPTTPGTNAPADETVDDEAEATSADEEAQARRKKILLLMVVLLAALVVVANEQPA